MPVSASEVIAVNDTTPPNITIISPLNNSVITTSSTRLNVTTNENAVCYYKLAYECSECEFAFNQMDITNASVHKHLLNLTNSSYNLTIKCDDDSGNSDSKSIMFYVAFPQPGGGGGGGGFGNGSNEEGNIANITKPKKGSNCLTSMDT